MKKIILFIFISLLANFFSFGQGTLRGKVTDKTGETLIGAAIYLKGNPSVGSVTDFDGNYSLKITDSLPQIVNISYIGYQLMEATVLVRKGEVVIKDFILISTAGELKEVEISAKATKAKSYYMEKVKMNSATSIDYISSETMKKTGDANVTAAVARVAGVSTNGAFITVRGIGDRYVKTAVNGMRIPTLDPFTNNIKLDIFPSSLVDNIIITKTASADLPGDWAGAYMSVETKDYPEVLALNIETSLEYNSQSSFKNVITSERSSTDWLGYDNTLRYHDHNAEFNAANTKPTQYQILVAQGLDDYYKSIGVNGWVDNTTTGDVYFKLGLVQLGLLAPALYNDPTAFATAKSLYLNGNYISDSFQKINAKVPVTAKSFPNNWNYSFRKAPLAFSQTISLGNQTSFLGKPLGYIAGFRYGNSTVYDGNSPANRASVVGDNNGNYIPAVSKLENRQISREINGWSALLNLSYKLNTNNSISLLFMPNVTGSNNVLNGVNSIEPFTRTITVSQFYEQRNQMIYQLKSEHFIPGHKIKIAMNTSFTNGKSSAPDFKNLQYKKDEVPNGFQYFIGNGIGEEVHRYSRYLTDKLFDANLSAEFPISRKPEVSRKLKIGGSYQYNRKESEQYDYQVRTANKVFNGNLDEYFDFNNFNVQTNTDIYGVQQSYFDLYYLKNGTPADNSFGKSTIVAGFAMLDYGITSRLRFAGGLRIEHADFFTDVNKYDELGYAENDPRRNYQSGLPAAKPGKLIETSFLPSANLIYKLKNDDFAPVNIRFNYSHTVARPSIRELSDIAVFDYELRSFVFGNSDLKIVNINNFDARIESYFASGDNLSGSVFYKNFKNHIELVKAVGFSWQNVERSYVAGIELEGTKKINKNFDFSANVTFAHSQTEFVRYRLEIGGSGTKEYFPQDTLKRTMFGQAPYVVNAIVSYHADSLGLTVTLSYNVQGSRLVIAADVKEVPDIFEKPRNLFDLKIAKNIGKHFNVSLTMRNLLNAPLTRAYDYTDGTELDFDSYRWGTTFKFAVSYKI